MHGEGTLKLVDHKHTAELGAKKHAPLYTALSTGIQNNPASAVDIATSINNGQPRGKAMTWKISQEKLDALMTPYQGTTLAP